MAKKTSQQTLKQQVRKFSRPKILALSTFFNFKNFCSFSLLPVPLKQRMLRRWQKREINHTPKNVVTSVSKTTSVHVWNSERQLTEVGGCPPTSEGRRGSREKCQSPLFEEFSDNEFDEEKEFRLESEREGRRGSGERERDETHSDRTQNERPAGDDGRDITTAVEGVNIREPQGAPQPNIGDVSGAITPSSHDARGDNITTRVDDVTSDQSCVKMEDRVGESREKVGGEGGAEKVEAVRKPKSLEELMSEDMEMTGVTRGEGEEEGSGGRREGRGGGGKSLEELMGEDMGGSGVVAEHVMEQSLLTRRGGEGESLLLMAADPREMQGQLPGKTPAKRKVQLYIYMYELIVCIECVCVL